MATLTKSKSSTAVLKQFIGGKWIKGSSSREIVSTNPADTREVVARLHGASKSDAQAALDAAAQARAQWKATPAPARARVLLKFAELAYPRVDELAALMTREQGKILPEAKGEMIKGLNLIEWFSGEGMRFMGRTAPSELPKNLLYTLREPLGVVSIITPWNFPWAIPCWKIAPALVAGNTVVFKPASLVPAFSVEIVKLFEQAGVPAGVINLVMGAGSEIGDMLVEDERVRGVSFTGSNEVGQGVHAIAGRRGIKATCEMGGKNPCVVWHDADMDLAMAGVVKGAFGSTGQRCTATSRLLLHEKIADSFLKKLIAQAKALKIGPGLKAGIGMGPAVDEGQFKTNLEYIEIAKKDGAKLVCGGHRLDKGELKHGFFVEPTIFDQVKPSMRIFQEEVFGPVLAVTRVKNYDEMIRAANDCRFGLTCAIYTNDISVAMRFTDEIETGMVHINSPTIGGEAQVPFGGVKGSGVGEKEMAKEGLHFFSESKTVFLDYTGRKRESSIY
ncbi:MAG: aldehyde dehydrogenase family protein [Elusimicrobiota bacterium]